MKRTLMLTMLATALLGGQVFAAESTGTAIEGHDPTAGDNTHYYGKYSETESVTGGNVTIKADEQGTVPNNASVYGGYTKKEGKSASNNTVTMQGGTVQSIYGGRTEAAEAFNNTVTMQGGIVGSIYGGSGFKGDSYNNTVIMTGGSVKTLYGGNASNDYSTSDNVVIVTGGSISTILSAGYAGAAATNNKMHLVGNGASNVNIADAQSNIGTYNGSNGGISLSNVIGGRASVTSISTGNSIDIYGTGIEISGMFAYMQVLTFNITNDAVTALTPEVAVTLTSTSPNYALDLTGVDLQVKDLDVKEWSAGMTVTLVQSEQVIKGLESGKAVNIMKDGKAVALGKLVLSDDNKTLSLIVQGNVPEPATSSLSLLALAGLCVRRRRK